MFVSLKSSIFSTFIFTSLVLAVDPSPTERAKWDAVCMEKAGSQFRMVFDANGQPTGRCEAPPVWKCYWGPYKDAKTGADGCCGKDKGTYSTDPNFPQEGGCCVSPNLYSFDNISNRGGCCHSGQGWTFDGAGAKGGCCATDRRWMVDTSYGTEGCCPIGSKLYTNHMTREGSCCMIPEVLSVEISTTKAGCCPTGLQYMTDTPSGLMGCCKSNQVFSVDRASNKGDCCDTGKVFVVDAASGKGGCCTAGQIYSVDATSGQGGCCNAGEAYKVDELTGNGNCCAHDAVFACDCACKPNPVPTCPTGHGKTFTASNGKKYKLFCGLINHGTNDLGQAPAADWADCINRCAAMSNCVRAIFQPTSKICYLRTHGNQVDPVQADVYDSAHLIEDTTPPVPTPDPTPDPPAPTPDPPVPTPDDPIPKECPQADGKRVTVGGIEYQLFCTKSFANTIEPIDATDAKDIEECMANCSKDPDCHGVNFFDDGQPQNCVEASEWEFEPTGNQLQGKTVVAIPVRKR